MTTTFQFRPAQRSSAKPLIGIFSESGAGKTYSALALARGFVGPRGRIGMIETESGRGEAYADPREYPEFAGDGQEFNYQVLSLHDDFSPKAYGKAITAAEAEKLDALIIDSASHEWEGVGGVLSMAATNEASGKKGVQVWQQPKIDHQREFMLRFMQTPIPLVILCMRAKYPMQQKAGKSGEWVRSEVLEPKQSEDILFEMFVHGWISRDDNHHFQRTKCTARSLEPVFESGKPITLETGRRLAAWAAGKLTVTKSEPQRNALLTEAERTAAIGTEALQKFWKSLNFDGQKLLEPEKERLKKAAEAADLATGVAGKETV